MDYENRLKALMQADDRLLVMTAENRAPIRSIPKEFPERFIDTGITEQTMVGAAAGLALRGRIPVAHALATFLTMRAFEFIRTDVGIPALPVKLVGFVPGFLSEANGPTHQALEDISLMRGIPNLNVFCPGDGEDLAIGLEAILLSKQPWYIRYIARKAPVTHSAFIMGEAETLSAGNEVTLLVYGTLLTEAVAATKILKNQGLSVRLINLRCLKPIDEAAILAAVTQTKLTVTLEDHFLIGGLNTLVAEILLKHRLTGRVLPLALDNRWFKPGLLPQVLDHEGFTGEKIAEKVLEQWRQI